MDGSTLFEPKVAWAEDFYHDKTVRFIFDQFPSAGYDTHVRMIAIV